MKLQLNQEQYSIFSTKLAFYHDALHLNPEPEIIDQAVLSDNQVIFAAYAISLFARSPSNIISRVDLKQRLERDDLYEINQLNNDLNWLQSQFNCVEFGDLIINDEFSFERPSISSSSNKRKQPSADQNQDMRRVEAPSKKKQTTKKKSQQTMAELKRLKQEISKQRNKESADRSRKKQKALKENLKKKKKAIKAEITSYKEEIAILNIENKVLKDQLEAWRPVCNSLYEKLNTFEEGQEFLKKNPCTFFSWKDSSTTSTQTKSQDLNLEKQQNEEPIADIRPYLSNV